LCEKDQQFVIPSEVEESLAIKSTQQ
jgi:hypothetical protein